MRVNRQVMKKQQGMLEGKKTENYEGILERRPYEFNGS